MTPDNVSGAKSKLREELLTDGLIDHVSLALVNSRVREQFPAKPLAERQSMTLETIRSMVTEGLFELGDRTAGGDRFKAFDEPLDESMRKMREVYVIHYHDDRPGWVFRYWLSLTKKGEEEATSTEYGRQIAKEVKEAAARWRAQQGDESP